MVNSSVSKTRGTPFSRAGRLSAAAFLLTAGALGAGQVVDLTSPFMLRHDWLYIVWSYLRMPGSLMELFADMSIGPFFGQGYRPLLGIFAASAFWAVLAFIFLWLSAYSSSRIERAAEGRRKS